LFITNKIFIEEKKIKGRKRHILEDHLGLLISAVISSGNCGDRNGLKLEGG